jgi:hypothetical protein
MHNFGNETWREMIWKSDIKEECGFYSIRELA